MYYASVLHLPFHFQQPKNSSVVRDVVMALKEIVSEQKGEYSFGANLTCLYGMTLVSLLLMRCDVRSSLHSCLLIELVSL